MHLKPTTHKPRPLSHTAARPIDPLNQQDAGPATAAAGGVVGPGGGSGGTIRPRMRPEQVEAIATRLDMRGRGRIQGK